MTTGVGSLAEVRTYRELFGVAEFRTLFAAQCLTMGAGATAGLALGTIVHAETGSAVLTGLSMFGGPLVALIASSSVLAASDTVRPRRALVAVASVVAVANLAQATPGMPWPARFGLLAAVWLVLAGSAGAGVALMRDLLPSDAFVLGRSTLNIAVGSMQVVAYGAGGLLLVALPPEGLFLLAATCSGLAAVLYRFRLPDRPARARGPVLRRTREVNRRLLGSRVLRPLYLSSWVPNGLIVGCEALFIPYAGHQAGYLLAATAAGMLAGDVVVGRFLPHRVRDRLVNPLRFLLAAPFLVFWLHPTIGVAMALGLVAAFGYADSLPLQERMVAHTTDDTMGQMLGLRAAGLGAGQAVGALLAGTTADLLGVGPEAAGRAMAVMGALSLLVSLALVPGLRRSRTSVTGSARVSPAPPATPRAQPHGGAPSGGAAGRPRSSGRPG